MERILALDVGAKRIGVAATDELGLTAQGLDTRARTRIREDIEFFRRLAVERGVQRIVLGDPRNLDGSFGHASAAVRDFGARLERATRLPVDYWDERLTSFEAEELLRESGVRPDRRSGTVDRIAAVTILKDYLESRG
ncbi:MAG: Holliday junction resolvase RuvX [Bryobacteraceae bacterium]|nr:Holliday junction resolvase RuvX [Bryobacteraceae bacterium]